MKQKLGQSRWFCVSVCVYIVHVLTVHALGWIQASWLGYQNMVLVLPQNKKGRSTKSDKRKVPRITGEMEEKFKSNARQWWEIHRLREGGLKIGGKKIGGQMRGQLLWLGCWSLDFYLPFCLSSVPHWALQSTRRQKTIFLSSSFPSERRYPHVDVNYASTTLLCF